MSDPIPYGTINPFIARFTLLNVPVTDANGEIYIYRLSDFKYWNDVSGLWEITRVSNAMTEISETNQTGDWIYNFDTAVALALQTDEYIVEMVDSAVAKSDNLIARISTKVVPEDITADVRRILGLQKDNFVHEALAYNDDNILTHGRIRVYDSPANANTDDGATGLLYEYDMIANVASKQLIKYTQTRTQ